MSGRRWDLQRDRSRVARQGAETIDGAGVQHDPPKLRTSKAKLRAEIQAAMAAADATLSRLIACRCGHRATVRVPVSKLAETRFRCRRCQKVTT